MEKKGAVISAFVGLAAMVTLMGVFVRNASPYVSIAQAKSDGGDSLHIAGEIEKDSLNTDLTHNQIRFTLKDEAGQTLPVVYTGAPPSNIGSSSKVVAIGAMKNGQLMSDSLLVKCPSRYQSKKPTS
jgi:cytochrome c-type biogenesis protein CcmE